MGEESLVARLRGSASYIDSVAQHGNFAYSGKSDAALLREAADALERAHEEGMRAAYEIAVRGAFDRDREADALYERGRQSEGATRKMQGATAAVIANNILTAIRALSPSTKDETK